VRNESIQTNYLKECILRQWMGTDLDVDKVN